MAVQRLSPTANLLRNSRLFSLPPPLVNPRDKGNQTSRYDSETATLPYPIQQALETTPSSLARGDWGLKRSLPLKSTTRTSTPTIRIQEIDSINHITDFESAADHVLNLKKWQEIGMPISRTQVNKGLYQYRDMKPRTSVFESEYDNTQPQSSISARKRWKYSGPWIAGQTAGEFKDYTEQKIKRLRPRFRRFLRIRLEESVAATARRDAIDNGMPPPEQSPEVDEQQLNKYIKRLRQENRGHLFNLIEEFLDLPSASEPSSKISSEDAWKYSGSGPPITHPSAGLSYLRASGHTSNHPALGPQEHDRPIQARILDDQHRTGSGSGSPILGVGGVAVEAFGIDPYTIRRMQLSKDSVTLDQDILGGTKIWVQPKIVNVDSQGRIKAQIKLADEKTTALYETEAQKPLEPIPNPIANISRRTPNLTDVSSRSSNNEANSTYAINSNSSSETYGDSRKVHRSKPTERPDYRSELVKVLKEEKE